MKVDEMKIGMKVKINPRVLERFAKESLWFNWPKEEELLIIKDIYELNFSSALPETSVLYLKGIKNRCSYIFNVNNRDSFRAGDYNPPTDSLFISANIDTESNNSIYCNCQSPNTVERMVLNETYQYCLNCKKEKKTTQRKDLPLTPQDFDIYQNSYVYADNEED